MNSPRSIEVADIFRTYGLAYRTKYDIPLEHLRVMSAIERCRTEALGGHLDECDKCGYQHPSYNSCRDRHCPKCGGLAKVRWLAAREKELLPVMYFHVVLTLPDQLNSIALVNQKKIYEILFRAGSETLLELGKDPKHLGGEIGLMAVLHTWGQNLLDHPHLHCIVPGGGLSPDQRWLLPKKAKRKGKQKRFFIHVNIISDLFKKKFLFYLKKAYNAGELKFVGRIEGLGSPSTFQRLIDRLYSKSWVTYCKPSFGGSEEVLRYLARYTQRVAISNERLVSLEDGIVTFRWRDYRDGKVKLMKLEAFEFIRRFLLHVLPKNFYKIRYYGILSSRNRKTKLKRCKEVLGVATVSESSTAPSGSWEDLLLELTGIDVRICPRCGKGRMVTKEILPPIRAVSQAGIHAPP